MSGSEVKMVFGMNKKERRVPDLSRYDYHYQNKDEFNKSPRLSAAAAHAASVGAHAAGTVRSQPQRSQSMTHSSSQALRRGAANRVSGRVPRSAPANNYRSYSLRSQTSGAPRKDSMTSNNSNARVRNGNSSRTNSITVKTTEVRDAQGRTQSITRRTIRRANGYEYVETTTTTTQAIPVLDAEKHFDEFSGNFIMQDDGIEELSEEEPAGREQHKGHAYAALTGKVSSPNGLLSGGSDGEVMLDQTSSISQFSDALDYVPGTFNKQNRRTAKTNKRQASAAAAGQRVQQSHAQQPPKQQPKRSMTEKEMYARAYAIAQQNVYKTDDPSRNAGTATGQSRMAQRSLRDSAPVAAEPTIGGSSVKAKSKPKRISSFFQRNAGSQSEAIPQTAPAVIETSTPHVPKSPLPKGPVVTSKQKLSDEEMYQKALAIAQMRYGQDQTPIPTEQEAIGEQGANSAPTTAAESVNTKARKSEPLHNEPAPSEPALSEAMPSEAIPSETVQRSNSEIEERDSDMFEQPEATTVTKTTTPEANGNGQVSEWDRYDIEHQAQTNKKGAAERRSKFKNMFDKVKQFSIENSGYQPPKSAENKAAQVEPVATDEINIVQVTPLERNNSTLSHGASTTRNVQNQLEPQNRHFNDQASETSFRKSTKKSTITGPPSQQPGPEPEPITKTNSVRKAKNKNNFLKRLFNRS